MELLQPGKCIQTNTKLEKKKKKNIARHKRMHTEKKSVHFINCVYNVILNNVRYFRTNLNLNNKIQNQITWK